MNRSTQINSILETRKPLCVRIAKVEDNLRKIDTEVYSLQERCQQLKHEVDHPQCIEKLENINFSNLQKEISENLQSLSQLRDRLSRETLNIGVVGLMGQGKSRLLQTLSGLSNDEIPSLPGGACTAVRSTVYHHDGETYARVVFHSQDSFLNTVIRPYYEELNLGAFPKTLDEFTRPLPPLPENSSAAATKSEMYEHFKKYHQHFSKYRSLLKPISEVIQISQKEIPQYVTQNRENAEGQINYYHLAVKEVKIYSRFKNANVGKIALVDVPGLGDTKLGDEELMLKTIGQEVDVILFIRRPDSMRDQWKKQDTNLYDTAAIALKDLPERAFMVLNRVGNDAEQLNICQMLRDNIENISENGNPKRGMKFVQSEIADCSNQQEANAILEKVLDYLLEKIDALDQKSAQGYQDKIIFLHEFLNHELEKAKNCLDELAAKQNDLGNFFPKFNKIYEDLTSELDTVLETLAEQRDQDDTAFKEKLEEVLEVCRTDTGLPQIDQIKKRRSALGSYAETYPNYLNKIRSHLSQHFLSLDAGLKKSLERVKSKVADVFIAKLDKITDARGSDFIGAIAQKIPNTLILNQPSKIKFGFQMLEDFELSYRGLIQHRIRQHLDVLTPDSSEEIKISNNPSADQVLQILKTAHAKAVYNCENALADILKEPSQAAFAIVEEFRDRVFRADGVEDEWRTFLQNNRELIWSEFKLEHQNTQRQKEWLELIEKIEQVNQLEALFFLKS